MSKLYRIKPLEWEENPTVNLPWSKESTAAGYRVYQAGIDFDAKKEMIVARNPWGWTISDEYFDSIEAAKAACESHRRKLLEAELEPVYQPSTELPTEPGLYWWIPASDDKAKAVHLLNGGELAPCWYNPHIDRINPKEWGKHFGKGQWIRIPEPEDAV